MPTGFVHDPRCLEHDTGPSHVERPERLTAVVDRLQSSPMWDELVHITPEPIDEKWLLACHDQDYIDRVKQACAAGLSEIDSPDCVICPETFEIAKLSAGAAIAVVDAIMAGSENENGTKTRPAVTNAFCAMRPPGHHAERDRAMGFCFFANVAIAAEYFIKQHSLKRVAIVDFDVHHGNGTQHIHEARDDILFISLHEHPAYQWPGTGYDHEIGLGAGEGYTLNLPIEPPAGDNVFRELFKTYVIPKLDGFAPEAVIISAGFDAAVADPLGHLEVTTEGFAWMTRQIKRVADVHAKGRLLSCLEGGYDLEALSAGVQAHVRVLMENPGRQD